MKKLLSRYIAIFSICCLAMVCIAAQAYALNPEDAVDSSITEPDIADSNTFESDAADEDGADTDPQDTSPIGDPDAEADDSENAELAADSNDSSILEAKPITAGTLLPGIPNRNLFLFGGGLLICVAALVAMYILKRRREHNGGHDEDDDEVF